MKTLIQKRKEGVKNDKNNSQELYIFLVSVLGHNPEVATWLAGHVVDVRGV